MPGVERRERSMEPWHSLDAASAVARLGSDASRGLSDSEAARRLGESGANEIVQRLGRSPWIVLGRQLTSAMPALLSAAVILSLVIGDLLDALSIGLILALNALLGFAQEYKAERSIQALKRLVEPKARVRRSGRTAEVPSRELVPGDIMILEAGSLVPADGRLIEAAGFSTQEAALTGESGSVPKALPARPDPREPLAERGNMVYLGTTSASGRALAVVTETGMRTEMGKIARSLEAEAWEPTPLQRRLEQLGRGLARGALAVVAFFFLMGWWRGEPLRLVVLTSIGMAVAAVPEGLPSVVTVVLALAAQRMLKRKALVRRLTAVEALGSVTVICADKTGTLTENRMSAAVLETAGLRLDIPEALRAGRADPEFALLLAAGALCNDAVLRPEPDLQGRSRAAGDPTEGALVAVAADLGLAKPDLEGAFPRVAEVPFDSGRKRMSTVHEVRRAAARKAPGLIPGLEAPLAPGEEGGLVVFTKGSVEGLLEICSSLRVDGAEAPFTRGWRERVLASSESLSRSGLRVLGLALRRLRAPASEPDESLERDMTFIGLAGMSDPPRPQAREAVRVCRQAGIRPVMVTGDHLLTALNVAKSTGILEEGGALTGHELAGMSPSELEGRVERVSVFARISPEQKLQIVSALNKRGHIVAMTGDGVNDAPALKRAAIGVAMGVSGTDVAKEAAAMVLLDDDFATIVAAVKEGRVLYDNIRKFIRYSIATNTGELWVMLLAPLFGMPLPLTPLQILWINLITDGLPALALGLEPPEGDVMLRPPRDPDERLLDGRLIRHVLWVGLLMASISLGVGYAYWRAARPAWQTILLMTLVLAQMANVLAIRSERASTLRVGWASNPALLGAVALTSLSQLAIVYLPFCQRIFRTVPLSPGELGLSVLLGASIFCFIELEKWLVGRSRGLKGRCVAWK